MDIGNYKKKVDLNEGEWVGDIPGMPDVRLKVRSINYRPYQVAISGLARRRGKQLNSDEGMLAFTESSGVPLAEHILLDWDGIKNNGKPQKFDAKMAAAILSSDDEMGIGASMRRAVEYAANEVAERIINEAKEAAGN